MIIPVTEAVTITDDDMDMAKRLYELWSKKLSIRFIAQELARAREEGYRKGYQAGLEATR